jgi:ankyrin repeat protein
MAVNCPSAIKSYGQKIGLWFLVVIAMVGLATFYLHVGLQQERNSIQLLYAIRADDLATVRRLLISGADPNAIRSKRAPLLPWEPSMGRRQSGSPNETTALGLALKCDDGFPSPSEANTAIITELLSAGADPNYVDSDGLTPLLMSIRQHRMNIAVTLLRHGANVDKRGSVRFVIHANIDAFETVSSTRMPPLGLAAAQGFPDIVRLLLDAHADRAAKDDSGSTPLVWALQGRNASRRIRRERRLYAVRTISDRHTIPPEEDRFNEVIELLKPRSEQPSP